MTIQLHLNKRFQEKLDNSPDTIQKKVNHIINQLENQTYHDVTKLAPHKDLYRVKVNQGETRILFFIAKAQATTLLIFVDLIERHKYEKSVYVKQSINIDEDVLQLIKIQDIVPNIKLEDKRQDGSTIERKQRNIVISKDKAVILTKDQEEVLAGQLPAIVYGVAGTGKTLVALEIIRKIVDDLNTKSEKEIKVAYISLSDNLVKEAEKSYWNTEEQEDSNKDQVSQTQVEFLTYDSFLKKQPGSEEIRGKKPIDRKVFLLWFEQKSKKKEYKKYKDLGDQIFEEFSAVITGSNTLRRSSTSSDAGSPHNVTDSELKDNYYNLGVKQSIFGTEGKDNIFKLYLKYRKYILNNKEYYDSNIMTHQLIHNITGQKKIYNLVVVDEAQDLTLVQLKLILDSIKWSEEGKFILFCDENQIIHPSFFSQSMLNTYLRTAAYSTSVCKYSLNDNHRNSPMVQWLMNGLSHVKEQLLPISSKKQSIEVESASKQSHPEATARYLILTDQHKKHIGQEIKTSIQLVVIVPNDNSKEKAKKIFPGLLVFNVYEIKGLEYPHVILFNFFSGNKDQFEKICKCIKINSDNSLGIQRAESKDKGDKSYVGQLKLGLNFLYVAITRGIKTVSLVEEQGCAKQNRILIDYFEEKGYLKKTTSITSILEGNVEDSLSDLKDEAMKLVIRGNTEQARAIVDNISKKYIDGNNNENKQEAEKYIKEIEEKIKSDSDKVNSKSTNDTESDNDKLKKIQVNEPQASTSHDNYSGAPDHSTGALLKKRTPIALKVSHSIQDETSTKSSKKQKKKYTKNSTIESRTGKEDKDENIIKSLKAAVERCSEDEIMNILKAKKNLAYINKLDQESRNKVFDINDKNLLHCAAQNRWINLAQFIVTNKLLNVNSKTADGMTTLHIAAICGNTELVELLLNNGADSCAATLTGITPLHFVALIGNVEIARLLIKKGVNVDVKGSDGMTPLHVVVQSGNIEVAGFSLLKKPKKDYTELVKLLLDKGADINVQAGNGITPLHFAVKSKDTELVKLLLEKGADVNVKAGDGMTTLHFAAQSGNIEVVRLVFAKGIHINDINVKAGDGMTTLHFALQSGSIEVVSLLFEQGADVNVKAGDGMTTLHFAAQSRSIEVVRLVFAKGADINDINVKADNSMTPLHYAAQSGSIEVTELFLKQGADIDVKTGDGMTPLHFAVLRGNTGVARLLIDNGADVNAATITTCITPLYVAANAEDTELVKLLLYNGANINAKVYTVSEGQLKCSVVAEIAKNENIKDLITDKERERTDNKFLASVAVFLKGNLKLGVINELLEKDSGPKPGFYYTTKKNNETVISLATENKNQELLELLLKYAVKIMQIKPVKDLLSIKDDNGKLLLGTEYVKDLLSELKNDEQGADAERKEKIIEILTAAIGNLLPTNTSEVDSNPASEDSDTGESKLYHEGITENTDSEIEIEMNDDDELEHIPLGRQSQNWHYNDNV